MAERIRYTKNGQRFQDMGLQGMAIRTEEDNLTMRRVIEKLGFTRCELDR